MLNKNLGNQCEKWIVKLFVGMQIVFSANILATISDEEIKRERREKLNKEVKRIEDLKKAEEEKKKEKKWDLREKELKNSKKEFLKKKNEEAENLKRVRKLINQDKNERQKKQQEEKEKLEKEKEIVLKKIFTTRTNGLQKIINETLLEISSHKNSNSDTGVLIRSNFSKKIVPALVTLRKDIIKLCRY